jgi:DNA-binding HxlR family transcriptional regulator
MDKRKISSVNFKNEIFLEERCVLNKVIKIIGRRWVTEILLLIEKDIRRFSALKETLDGISDNVLSHNLNQLVAAGLLEKQIYQQVPLKVEYYLSESGRKLLLQLHQLCGWGRLYVEDAAVLPRQVPA